MSVVLYIEGAGPAKLQQTECREGFRKLIERAGFKGRMPRTRACGSRNDAFKDFVTAVHATSDNEYLVLLVDSEAAVNQPPWEHLRMRDGWTRPPGVDDDQAQLMVQCMESWCIADRQALQGFFGQCLQTSALPPLIAIEDRSKDDVQSRLVNATRQCGRDRAYAKGARSFALLGRLDPDELKRHLPHFVGLCDMLSGKL